ncbi:SUF system NifU family Fe-S cluster assembly protein [Candidatus Sumerlaeota bacterium]|nr:SUF system NifU family Fe-S cluster assembly protein [Candidatus Sumerlaeota bacterium]MBI3735840.1 SUF system NifU family Fe-S cluster assembly protein [Candidatus Sumerlaeota bacterium]
MSDLRDLYQEVILDHGKKPRNFHAMETANHQADGHNPLCGDKLRVFLQMEGGVVKDISFLGSGCAISTASASMMTQVLKGKTEAEAEALFQRFHHLLTEGEEKGAPAGGPELGKLEVFAGVREFPIRVKCATLPWHTMHAALKDEQKAVSTE